MPGKHETYAELGVGMFERAMGHAHSTLSLDIWPRFEESAAGRELKAGMANSTSLAPALPAVNAAARPGTPWVRLGSLLQLPLRHAQHLLLFSVFGFRLLEHWHAPQDASALPRYIVPPPPPLPPLPPGTTTWGPSGVCPACRMAPQDPTASPSGFVFCAKCIYPAVAQTGQCPASRQPVHVAELRRLYETSRPGVS